MKTSLLSETVLPHNPGSSEPEAIDVLAACRMLGISRTKFYELLNDGTVPSFKIGRRRLVRPGTLRQVLASLEQAGVEGRAAA